MRLFSVFLLLLSSLVAFSQTTLAIPPVIDDTTINLELQNGTHQFIAGHDTATMGVNGSILGPTLIMHKDSTLNIHVTNNLGQPTTIHWHGMHVNASNDGGPHTVIEPGDTWNPQFTVMNKASTMWYHPHLDEYTDEHVSKGIAGFILIKDDEEAALNLPRTYGVDDFPLAIQTKQLDASYQIIHHTNHDDLLMVNATVNPMLDVPAQMIRLRLLNGTTQRVLNIGLTANQIFYQIATDGGLRETPLALTRLQLASGERTEILIDLAEMQGETLHLMSYASEFGNGIYGSSSPGMNTSMPLTGYSGNALNGNDFNILQLNVVAQNSNPVTSIPSSLTTLNPYSETESDQSRSLELRPIQMGINQLNGDFTINGVSLDMNTINITIPLNNTEIWTFNNNSAIAHPIHIHDVQFYILDINGAAPPTYAQGLKDTFLVPGGGGSMRVITKFEDFADDAIPYMYHCHMLTHEDGGMMGQFVVVDPNASVNDLKDSSDLILYPNPSDSIYMTIQLQNQDEQITAYAIVDETGRIVRYDKIHENELNYLYSFPVFELASGLYSLKVFTKKQIYTKKFIKK